ncbi:MAG TPA: DUF3499 family protein [Acidimicrobiia bacterium]|nr:DUF3499 family protein [Acidimicrobiia bacterium]
MVSGPIWDRPDGVDHQRFCARRGCDAPAVATLRFQPGQRAAWLIDVDAGAARSERDLCNRHATVLVLPTGWRLFDGRRAPDGDAIAEPPGLSRPALRARRSDLASVPVPVEHLEQPVTDEEPEGDEEAEDDEEAAEGEPQQPRVAGEALIDVLDARTPLLQRAFRNVWPGADDS